MSRIKIHALKKNSLTCESYQNYLHHFLNPSLHLKIDKTSQFSKQSSEVHELLKRIKDANEYDDDFFLAAQKFINKTYWTTENLANSTIALDNSSQNYCLNFNDSTANSVNGITDDMLRQSPPIIDQQQVINIFCNGNQGYKKYITKKNYDTIEDTIGLANHYCEDLFSIIFEQIRLFANARESQEQNSNLLSQNKVLQIKNNEVEERNRALGTDITNLKLKNKETKECNCILETENTNLRVNNKEAEERNHALGKDITKLKVKNKETEERNHTLETENTNLKVYNKEIEERNHALETDNTNLKVNNKETKERNHGLESQNIILKNENTDLKLKDKDHAKLKTTYAVLESEHENLKLSYNDLEAKVTELEIKLGDISKKYSDLLTEYLNLEVIYAALQD
ncbi:23130_t:CDS:2, partial [Gigaspora margarita]